MPQSGGPPLSALQVEFAARLHNGQAPKTFVYRGVQPLFDGANFTVNASEDGAALSTWTANADGAPTMKGTATW